MKAIFITFCIFLMSACTFTTGIKPDVSLVDVQFTDATIFETTGKFEVRVQNANPYELSFEGAAHDIYLNGIHIGKGLVNETFTVPKLGTATQTVTIHLSNLSLIRNLQTLIEAKEYDYRIDSTLYKSGTFGLSRYKVSESGKFSKF